MSKEKEGKRIHLSLTRREVDMLEYIDQIESGRGIPNAIHTCISGWYMHKYFDKRSKDPQRRKSESSMTNEDYCVNVMGGEVDEKEGKCIISPASGVGVSRIIPLGIVKTFKPEK